jgi:hypothetical protein
MEGSHIHILGQVGEEEVGRRAIVKRVGILTMQ